MLVRVSPDPVCAGLRADPFASVVELLDAKANSAAAAAKSTSTPANARRVIDVFIMLPSMGCLR
jgi:hypothetical protein